MDVHRTSSSCLLYKDHSRAISIKSLGSAEASKLPVCEKPLFQAPRPHSLGALYRYSMYDLLGGFLWRLLRRSRFLRMHATKHYEEAPRTHTKHLSRGVTLVVDAFYHHTRHCRSVLSGSVICVPSATDTDASAADMFYRLPLNAPWSYSSEPSPNSELTARLC